MRNIFKISAYSLLILSSLSSCEDPQAVPDVNEIGGYVYLEDQIISSFDEGVDLNLNLFTKSGITFNSIDIESGDINSTAVISGDMATFNTDFLGDLEIDDSYELNIISAFSNGKTAGDFFPLDVISPISVSEDPIDANLSTLPNTTLEYETFTLKATINSINLAIKKNKNGTYVDSGLASLDVTGGEINVEDTNYASLNLAIEDTLYYKFTAMSGSLSEEAENYIAIVPED